MSGIRFGANINYSNIELVAKLLKSCIKASNPKNIEEVNTCFKKVRVRFSTKTGLKYCSGYCNDYLILARRSIIENNFQYVDVLKELNITYGYNPSTRKWDGMHKDCKIGKRGR